MFCSSFPALKVAAHILKSLIYIMSSNRKMNNKNLEELIDVLSAMKDLKPNEGIHIMKHSNGTFSWEKKVEARSTNVLKPKQERVPPPSKTAPPTKPISTNPYRRAMASRASKTSTIASKKGKNVTYDLDSSSSSSSSSSTDLDLMIKPSMSINRGKEEGKNGNGSKNKVEKGSKGFISSDEEEIIDNTFSQRLAAFHDAYMD